MSKGILSALEFIHLAPPKPPNFGSGRLGDLQVNLIYNRGGEGLLWESKSTETRISISYILLRRPLDTWH